MIFSKNPLCKLIHDQGNLHDRVNGLRNELDEVQKALDLDPGNSYLRDEESGYVQAFNDAKLDEERFLRQKAKIKCSDNVEVTSNQIHNVFVSHYMTFLGLDMICDKLDSDGLFQQQVSAMSNETMTQPVTNEEIKMAMLGIGDDKSLGPDGFTSTFFKKGWDVVGKMCVMPLGTFLLSGNSLRKLTIPVWHLS
nr:hypothetical protein [Tanacetum cinerariifolium]